MKRLLIVAAIVAATAVGTATVAIGVANPLADDLATAESGLATAEADLAEATERGVGLRADLADAHASIDERAEREREMVAGIAERDATIDEQADAIEKRDAQVDRLEAARDAQAERARSLAEELDAANGHADELEGTVAALEHNVATLEDRLAEKMRTLDASDDICVFTYCTEEAAFGLDLIGAAGAAWFDAATVDDMIADLSRDFGVSEPSTRYGAALGGDFTGQYIAPSRIAFADHGGTYAWTALHEFAHHLECHTDGCVGHHSDGFIEAMRDVLDAVGL